MVERGKHQETVERNQCGVVNMLNYGKQWLDDDDIAEVTAVLKSDFLTQGPKVREFEEKLADYVDAMYAVAVSNGTAALHLAVRALLEEPGITKYTDG
ncbi:MAG: hypothetical protein GY940_01300, partial [bacterium]|nr:hypothetical protein [bacterium]